MKIQKISLYTNYNNCGHVNIDKHDGYSISKQNSYITPLIGYNLAFNARVDKGLTRFYEYNAERMPKTVKRYIEGLGDKTSKTPLEAQAAAFAGLIGLTSVQAIKEAFPESEEDLFTDLKEVRDSKATRGILGTYRENKDLFELDNLQILSDGEDFTVWLVKKIFIEAKTLDEINEDFKEVVNPEFQRFYEDKEISEVPIRFSTLKALGIKQPDNEYMQSLRYTREGYSDIVGEKISEAQRTFWESMPIEERTARARKSVEKFENWWNSLTQDQKLEMIALQEDELKMLKDFNSSEFGKVRGNKKYAPKKDKPFTPRSKKIKTESELSRDDLFKIWAANNLKIFEENLTELDKSRIEAKRLQHRIEAWNSMTPEEKTEYIDRLRSGSEELRYAIIQAWNENPDILVMLGKNLTKDHVEKPTEILYGTESFNQFMSASMSAFWASNPDYAQKFGDSIKAAYSKIKDAVASGRFEQMKAEIMRDRANRIQATTTEISPYKAILSDTEYEKYPDFMREFIDAYSNCPEIKLQLYPIQYLKDFFQLTQKTLSPEVISSWTKHLLKEDLTPEEQNHLKLVETTETPETFKLNRAIEATFAEILYDCTGQCEVYLLSNAQLQLAIAQVSDGNNAIKIEDPESKKSITIPVKTNSINLNKINSLYSKFSKPIERHEIYSIIERFFNVDPDKTRDINKIKQVVSFLESYIDLFGESNKIAFSDESLYPQDVRLAFLHKFKSNMADVMDICRFEILLDSPIAIVKEDKITKIDGLLRKKYSFLPEDMLKLYIYEVNKILRHVSFDDLRKMESLSRNRAETVETPGNSLIVDRIGFNPNNQLHILGMEQALADILYKATGEEKFYALTFEELIDCIESFRLQNRFPRTITDVQSSLLNENFDIKLKKKLDLHKLKKLYQEYATELDKLDTEYGIKETRFDKDDLLYTLNPMDNEELIDKYTSIRINSVFKYL